MAAATEAATEAATAESGSDAEEQSWGEYMLGLPDFDLYEALHVKRGEFNPARARAAYHRLSQRMHPSYGRRGDERAFAQLTVAYNALKDPERRRIYDEHGLDGLKKSEQFMEPSVFELDPYEEYDRFYSAEDPEVKEYFLLNGADNTRMSDSEDEQLALEEEAAQVAQEAALDPEAAKLALERAKEIDKRPMPPMPVVPLAVPFVLPPPSLAAGTDCLPKFPMPPAAAGLPPPPEGGLPGPK